MLSPPVYEKDRRCAGPSHGKDYECALSFYVPLRIRFRRYCSLCSRVCIEMIWPRMLFCFCRDHPRAWASVRITSMCSGAIRSFVSAIVSTSGMRRRRPGLPGAARVVDGVVRGPCLGPSQFSRYHINTVFREKSTNLPLLPVFLFFSAFQLVSGDGAYYPTCAGAYDERKQTYEDHCHLSASSSFLSPSAQKCISQQ